MYTRAGQQYRKYDPQPTSQICPHEFFKHKGASKHPKEHQLRPPSYSFRGRSGVDESRDNAGCTVPLPCTAPQPKELTLAQLIASPKRGVRLGGTRTKKALSGTCATVDLHPIWPAKRQPPLAAGPHLQSQEAGLRVNESACPKAHAWPACQACKLGLPVDDREDAFEPAKAEQSTLDPRERCRGTG